LRETRGQARRRIYLTPRPLSTRGEGESAAVKSPLLIWRGDLGVRFSITDSEVT
jgi:hypothetical protein